MLYCVRKPEELELGGEAQNVTGDVEGYKRMTERLRQLEGRRPARLKKLVAGLPQGLVQNGVKESGLRRRLGKMLGGTAVAEERDLGEEEYYVPAELHLTLEQITLGAAESEQLEVFEPRALSNTQRNLLAMLRPGKLKLYDDGHAERKRAKQEKRARSPAIAAEPQAPPAKFQKL